MRTRLLGSASARKAFTFSGVGSVPVMSFSESRATGKRQCHKVPGRCYYTRPCRLAAVQILEVLVYEGGLFAIQHIGNLARALARVNFIRNSSSRRTLKPVSPARRSRQG